MKEVTQSAAAEIDLSEYETEDHGHSCHQTRIESPRRNQCLSLASLNSTNCFTQFIIKGQEGDNDGTSAGGIHALRARILEVLRQEPYMGEKIPMR